MNQNYQSPEGESPGESSEGLLKPGSVRPLKSRRLLITASLAAIAASLISALCFLPLDLVLAVVPLGAFCWAVIRFRRDNAGLLAEIPLKRKIRGLIIGVGLFLVVLIVMLPGLAFAYSVDLLTGRGIDALIALANSGAKPPEAYHFPWYHPLGWLEPKAVRIVEDFQMIRMQYWARATLVPLKNFLSLVSFCTWSLVGFTMLRTYFHFVARVVAADGTRITMELPRYKK